MRDLLLDALATFRLTRLVTQDEITEGLRTAVTRWADDGPSTQRSRDRREKVVTLSSCPWCFSAWSAMFVVCARRVCPRVWDLVAKVLSYSALTGLLGRVDQ